MATIKEAEDHCTAQVHAHQQSHREGILNFEQKVLEKKAHTCLSILEACVAALRACTIEAHGVLLCPLQLLMGNILPDSLLTAGLQPAPLAREPPSTVPLHQHLNCHPPPQELNGGTTIWGGGYWTSCSCQRAYSSEVEREEAPHGAQRKPLRGFCQDTDLVQATRQMYFEVHCPAFDQEGSHDLSSLFWEMITSANLLGSKIYKVKEVWAGWKELRFVHHAMRGLPKGLPFFHLVSPSESPKVMGWLSSEILTLRGAHPFHPDTLHCHPGLLYCPLCGKEGQNEGTVIIICRQCTSD